MGETAPKGADRQVGAEEEENQQALLEFKKPISYRGFQINKGYVSDAFHLLKANMIRIRNK